MFNVSWTALLRVVKKMFGEALPLRPAPVKVCALAALFQCRAVDTTRPVLLWTFASSSTRGVGLPLRFSQSVKYV